MLCVILKIVLVVEKVQILFWIAMYLATIKTRPSQTPNNIFICSICFSDGRRMVATLSILVMKFSMESMQGMFWVCQCLTSGPASMRTSAMDKKASFMDWILGLPRDRRWIWLKRSLMLLKTLRSW